MKNENPATPDMSVVPPSSPCTCFRIRKLGRLLTQRYDAALALAGMNVNQYSILRRASHSMHTISELALDLGMDRTTLTRDLKHLIEAKWIRLACGKDARQKLVVVTATGKRIIARAHPLWLAAQQNLASEIGDGALDDLHTRLDHMVQRLEPQR